jgi:hypothetical protein
VAQNQALAPFLRDNSLRAGLNASFNLRNLGLRVESPLAGPLLPGLAGAPPWVYGLADGGIELRRVGLYALEVLVGVP